MWPHCVPSPSSYLEDSRGRWWILIGGRGCELCIRNRLTNRWMKHLSGPPSTSFQSKSWESKWSQSMLLLQCRQPLQDRRVACWSSCQWYSLTAGNESTSGNPSLDWSFRFDELGDNLIGRGGHRGVFDRHEFQEDYPLVVSWDCAKEVDDVLLLTDLGGCLCRGISVGSVSICGRWPCAEIVNIEILIDPRLVIVDISVVLWLDTPKVFPNLEDVEL